MYVSTIATMWGSLVLNGDKTYSQVPRLLKAQVAYLLTEAGREDLVIE